MTFSPAGPLAPRLRPPSLSAPSSPPRPPTVSAPTSPPTAGRSPGVRSGLSAVHLVSLSLGSCQVTVDLPEVLAAASFSLLLPPLLLPGVAAGLGLPLLAVLLLNGDISRLCSHWSSSDITVLSLVECFTKNHKEPAQGIQSPQLGAFLAFQWFFMV